MTRKFMTRGITSSRSGHATSSKTWQWVVSVTQILRHSKKNFAFGTVVSLAVMNLSIASTVDERWRAAQQESALGNNIKAARYYFSVYTDSEPKAGSLGRLTESLIKAKYFQAASYFYLKILQQANATDVNIVAPYLTDMVQRMGPEFFQKELLGGRVAELLSDKTQFHYLLGRQQLLHGEFDKALASLRKVSVGSHYYGGLVAYHRGVALSLNGQLDSALELFRACERLADQSDTAEAFDLENRCRASQARVLYEKGDFEKAEDAYDEVSKNSIVWTDILFEQAWNFFAKGDYNRALGKLVTYRAPILKFVYNPEVEVLRAQSYAAMCLWDDVNSSVNDFNKKYYDLGIQLKSAIEKQGNQFHTLYGLGKQSLRVNQRTQMSTVSVLARYTKGPQFATFVRQEQAVSKELDLVSRSKSDNNEFYLFLEKVLSWRLRTVRTLGGVFIRNTLIDAYSDLLAQFDKMSFIKTEMLAQMKNRIQRKSIVSRDADGILKRGTTDFTRKDHQYYWSFNGEFWNDELGDYVFALESECQ